MELMIVKDIMSIGNEQVILTGPLLLKKFSKRSEIEQSFGASVKVKSIDGKQTLVPVRGISVSQAMSGAWQVSLAIDYPNGMPNIALNSVITNNQ